LIIESIKLHLSNLSRSITAINNIDHNPTRYLKTKCSPRDIILAQLKDEQNKPAGLNAARLTKANNCQGKTPSLCCCEVQPAKHPPAIQQMKAAGERGKWKYVGCICLSAVAPPCSFSLFLSLSLPLFLSWAVREN